MTERLCECGCGTLLKGKRAGARYASDACRVKAYRARHGIVGYRPVKALQNGSGSGLQLSFRRVIAEFRQLTDRGVLADQQRRTLEGAVRDILPPRQREQLKQRTAHGRLDG